MREEFGIKCMIKINNFKYYNTMVFKLMNIAFIMLFNLVYSQGGWDLKYIPISLVDKSFIGKEIRIDFKDSINDEIHEQKISKFKIRNLLSHESTIDLFILEESLEFKESWNLYVDQGFLNEQFLINSLNPSHKIHQIYIENLDEDSFYLRANYNINGTEKIISLNIKKKLIKGILTKE